MVTCFDVVSMVVEEATEKFASKYRLNHTDYEYLETYCKIIDNLADEFDADSFTACIDEHDMTVVVCIECEDLTILNADHAFYALAENSISINFSATHDENMQVKFVFPSVWQSI